MSISTHAGDKWEEIPDDRLLRYTRFLMQHNKELPSMLTRGSLKVKAKVVERTYVSSDQAYFSAAYSEEGRRLERTCEGEENVPFLADEYLAQARTEREDWVDFFARVGVQSWPRVINKRSYFNSSDIEAVREACARPDLEERQLESPTLEMCPAKTMPSTILSWISELRKL